MYVESAFFNGKEFKQAFYQPRNAGKGR